MHVIKKVASQSVVIAAVIFISVLSTAIGLLVLWTVVQAVVESVAQRKSDREYRRYLKSQ